ncbi:MAG: nucleoside hydrolase [Lachnospiraceae bacterium]|nr:nucleoside hydrolase [Lachnospiraceae bacterium]
MLKRPLIIDCDPGIDDAECLMMVHGSGQFDIRGITAVHGNVPLAHTANNALFLSHLYGIGCPVYLGAKEALIQRLERAEYVHGNNGLIDFDTTLPEGVAFAEGHAWDFIWEEAVRQNGELEILAIGPLTNLAIAVMKHPELPKLVKNLVIMGGSAGNGNFGVYSEYNIAQDPHACEIVLQAGFPKFTMVDLNACRSVYLTNAECDGIRNLPDTNRFAALGKQMLAFQEENKKKLKDRGEGAIINDDHYTCDPVAAAVLIDESIGQYVDKYVFCDCVGEMTTGQTVIDWLGFAPIRNVRIPVTLDRDKFAEIYFNCVKSYDKEGC